MSVIKLTAQEGKHFPCHFCDRNSVVMIVRENRLPVALCSKCHAK